MKSVKIGKKKNHEAVKTWTGNCYLYEREKERLHRDTSGKSRDSCRASNYQSFYVEDTPNHVDLLSPRQLFALGEKIEASLRSSLNARLICRYKFRCESEYSTPELRSETSWENKNKRNWMEKRKLFSGYRDDFFWIEMFLPNSRLIYCPSRQAYSLCMNRRVLRTSKLTEIMKRFCINLCRVSMKSSGPRLR